MGEEFTLSRRDLLRAGAALGGAAALGATGLASACGNNDDSGTGPVAQTPVSTPAPTPVSTPAPTAPSRGGTLRFGELGGSSTDSLDPHEAFHPPDLLRGVQLYGTLVTRDDDFNLKDMLVEFIPGDNVGTIWDLRIREGIEFHHGKTATADDLIFSLQRLFDPSNPGVTAVAYPQFDPNGVRRMDNRTVRVTLSTPNALLREQQAGQTPFYLVPEDYDPANPVGAGPFKFKSFIPGDRSVFERFDNYFEQVASLDEIEIINFSDGTSLLNAHLADQIDAARRMSANSVAQLTAAGKKAIVTPDAYVHPISMRMDMPPFDDVRVRQAFRLMIDRPQLIDQIYAGEASLGNDLYSRLDPMYADHIPQREQDLDEAKSLLRAAGQEDLTVEFVTAPVLDFWTEIAAAFAEQARAAGVTINVRTVDAGTLIADYWTQQPLANDGFGSFSYMSVSAASTIPTAPFPTTRQDIPEYNDLYDEALRTVDYAAREALVHRMQEIQHEQGGFIIFGNSSLTDVVNANVHGFESGLKHARSYNNFELNRAYIA